jgi:putative ATPase
VACQQAVHFIGMPEGFLPMAEACLYLALAPKSNSALTSYVKAMEDVKETSHQPVPLHLRNAVTGLMHSMGYGRGYRYAHAEPEHFAREENYLPEELKGRKYYFPGGIGREAELAARLQQLRGEELPGGDRD